MTRKYFAFCAKSYNGHYWICIPKGKFRLSSHTAYIKEKWEYVEDELKLIYEPVYERYEEGEVLLDPNGVPIQEMEQVPIFEERETTYVTTKEEPVEAFWDPEKREYHILVENETDWSVEKEEVEETFRAVTGQTVGTISYAPNFKPSEHGVLIHFNCEDIDRSIRQVMKQGGSIVIPRLKFKPMGNGILPYLLTLRAITLDFTLTNLCRKI